MRWPIPQVFVVVTPEHGLISTTLSLEPLWSGFQAAEVTLNQLQVQGICSEGKKRCESTIQTFTGDGREGGLEL